jgi:hypothetical protein
MGETPEVAEVIVPLGPVPGDDVRGRLLRVGTHLAGLSDREFRAFGEALLKAIAAELPA